MSVGSLGDAELAQALVAGHHEALKEAFDRHGASVLAVARRVTRDPALAEDVVQEVFLRLWRWPERFDGHRGSLRAYLLVDANARAIELVRSTAARRGREDRSVRLEPDCVGDVEGEAWEILLAEHLSEALDSLAEVERTAIELAYYGGHSYRQVAEILGQPEGTIKSRIRSGLLRLRDRLMAVEIGGGSWHDA